MFQVNPKCPKMFKWMVIRSFWIILIRDKVIGAIQESGLVRILVRILVRVAVLFTIVPDHVSGSESKSQALSLKSYLHGRTQSCLYERGRPWHFLCGQKVWADFHILDGCLRRMGGQSSSVKAWAKYSTGEYFMNNFISVRRINVDLWNDRKKSDSLSIQKNGSV